jgi:hypothetical protein
VRIGALVAWLGLKVHPLAAHAGFELLTPQERKDYRPVGCSFKHVAFTGEPS